MISIDFDFILRDNMKLDGCRDKEILGGVGGKKKIVIIIYEKS